MSWNFNNERSIYAQLIEQIQNRIITGAYPLGSRLASVRDLAGEAEVNPNTMQKALTELERVGLVYSQRTSGRYVTDDEGRIEDMKKKVAKDKILTFIQQMKDLGIEEAEIISLIHEVTEKEKAGESNEQ